MGTPDFAVPSLKALVNAGENVTAVFTQPDKPKGRGYKMIPTPVKEAAAEMNIPVYQPLSLRKGDDAAEALEVLKQNAPDLIVVVAYGQILPEEILSLPKHGCINVHGSLLPEYRGAAPMQWCLLNGEKKTGRILRPVFVLENDYILSVGRNGFKLLLRICRLILDRVGRASGEQQGRQQGTEYDESLHLLKVKYQRCCYGPVVGDVVDSRIRLEVGPERAGLQAVLGILVEVAVDDVVDVAVGVGTRTAAVD